MSDKVVILGAGVAGLAAAERLGETGIESVVYEQEATYGGLCNSFSIDGFTFDTFAHVSFDNNTCEWFESRTESFCYSPQALNYDNGNWIEHPVINNLHKLEDSRREGITDSFVCRDTSIIPDNYGDWLKQIYGAEYALNYPYKYTRKYWTVEPEMLEIKWAKGRLYEPTLSDVKGNNRNNVSYQKEIRYPVRDGFKAYLRPMAEKARIVYNKKIVRIDERSRVIEFADGTQEDYDYLISTIPLPSLCGALKHIPKETMQAAEGLDYTSGYIVSLGLNKEKTSPALWYYIYDENIPAARIYSPDWKSPNNVPEGCSAVQAEIYYSKYRPIDKSPQEVMGNCIERLLTMGLFNESDIVVKDIRQKEYANIMFTPGIYYNRRMVHEYINSVDIDYAGRFGEWDYLWAGQSLLSGRKAADRIYGNIKSKDQDPF